LILVCGSLGDRVLAYTVYKLEKMGVDYHFLNETIYPEDYQFSWRYNNGEPKGYIKCDDFKLKIDEITGIYVRHVNPTSDGTKDDPARLEYLHALDLIINSAPCKVINRAYTQASNGSKPYQALILRRHGFKIPRTILTNLPDEAQNFIERCESDAIFKSISGIRSIVQRVNAERLRDIDLVGNCVTQFQEYIHGTEIRVHVIEDQVFATEISSVAVDYRYASREGLETNMRQFSLPDEVSERCVAVTKELGLVMSGIDLRRTTDGEYYCFEVNPSPGYSYYELHTGQEMSRALIDTLRIDL
jgi:glutathione synthase/RimK-type ligase-like ATP-grasp enzyme